MAPGAICSMNVRSALVGAAAAGVAGAGVCGRARGLAAGLAGLAVEASTVAGTPGISLQPGVDGLADEPPCVACPVGGLPSADRPECGPLLVRGPAGKLPPDDRPDWGPPLAGRPGCVLLCAWLPACGLA